MKTNEFIKFFEDEGFRLYQDDTFLSVTDEKDFVLFYIKRGVDLIVRFSDTDLPFSKQQEYYKVIFEYLMTPPEEREEEKKYYLKLKGFDGEQPYLCAYDFWNAWILIEKDSFTHGDEFYFKFTEENIKNLPEELKAHNWEQIEVESER